MSDHRIQGLVEKTNEVDNDSKIIKTALALIMIKLGINKQFLLDNIDAARELVSKFTK